MTSVVTKYVWPNATERPILNTSTPMPMKMIMNTQPNVGMTTEANMDFLAELKHSLENMTSRFWNYSVTVDVNPTGANLSVQQGQEDIQTTVGIIAVLCLLVAGKRLLNFSPSSCGKFSLSHGTTDLYPSYLCGKYCTEDPSDAGVYFLTHEFVSVIVTPY